MEEIRNYLSTYELDEQLTLAKLSKIFGRTIRMDDYPELKNELYQANTNYRAKIEMGRKERNNTRMRIANQKNKAIIDYKRSIKRNEILVKRAKEIQATLDFLSYNWKRYDDRYIVSDCGHVINTQTNKLNKHTKNPLGYLVVSIANQVKSVHRVVAELFIPNPNNLPEVNHIDGDKSNNNISNLEWTTHSENVKHSFEKLGRTSSFLINRVKPGEGKGYSYCKFRNKFISQGSFNGKVKYLGAFDTAEEAAENTRKYREDNNLRQPSKKGYTERNGRYIAQCNVKGKTKYLGCYKTPEEAIAKTKEYKESLV